MSAQAVIDAARDCIGTPFHHQGRQPRAGLDCAGLLIHAFRTAGYEAHDGSRYSRRPKPDEMRGYLTQSLVLVGDWQPADVLYFKIERDPQHLALWTGEGLIHAYLSAGRVVEHGMDPRWTRRLVERYRHRSLIDV